MNRLDYEDFVEEYERLVDTREEMDTDYSDWYYLITY